MKCRLTLYRYQHIVFVQIGDNTASTMSMGIHSRHAIRADAYYHGHCEVMTGGWNTSMKIDVYRIVP